MTVAVRVPVMAPAARDKIQAAEATGPAKALMEPDTSQAMPTRSGGAGTRRRMVRVNGAAVGKVPATRCASAVRASRMRSRGGHGGGGALGAGGGAQRACEAAGGGLLGLGAGAGGAGRGGAGAEQL